MIVFDFVHIALCSCFIWLGCCSVVAWLLGLLFVGCLQFQFHVIVSPFVYLVIHYMDNCDNSTLLLVRSSITGITVIIPPVVREVIHYMGSCDNSTCCSRGHSLHGEP